MWANIAAIWALNGLNFSKFGPKRAYFSVILLKLGLILVKFFEINENLYERIKILLKEFYFKEKNLKFFLERFNKTLKEIKFFFKEFLKRI